MLSNNYNILEDDSKPIRSSTAVRGDQVIICCIDVVFDVLSSDLFNTPLVLSYRGTLLLESPFTCCGLLFVVFDNSIQMSKYCRKWNRRSRDRNFF